MEDLFLNIMRLLGARDWVNYCDEDYGQLESSDDTYPVTFPAILINTPEVEWTNKGKLGQLGRCTITVRLVIDCYHDTHYGSTQEEDVTQHIERYQEINQLLHGFRPCDNASGLVRESTRFYMISHAIKIYESTYSCELEEHFTDASKMITNREIGIHFQDVD